MSTAAAIPATPRPGRPAQAVARLPAWWPLAALTLLAAVLRLSTLDLQSFWYDEAFTPVHVLHASLAATLRSVVHTENSPPLWYVLEWADARVLGTGEVALRLPSALAGIATVPVAWAIGRELSGRAAAILCAAIVAVNPLFVWYSQEARVYALFVLTAALAMLCFLRALREPTPRRMAAFALTAALALLTHYFAVFLLAPMALWLLWDPRTRRAALVATGALVLVGVALLPLISAQGGHGTQWIGRWPLSERLQAIPQYYLTGYTGSALGHGIELLVALPILAGIALGLWRMTGPAPVATLADPLPACDTHDTSSTPDSHGRPGARDRGAPISSQRGLTIALTLAACGVLTPIVLVAFGADYLAPRNLVAAMIPLTAAIAVLLVWPAARPGRAGPLATIALAGAIVVAFLAISIDIELSPRLQRGNWRGLAAALRVAPRERVITTVELGTAPLEYYMPGLRGVRPGGFVRVREIDETGYQPLVTRAGQPPAPGFHLLSRVDIDGLIAYRFVSPVARRVSEATLRRHVITLASPAVLGSAGV
ncbi:MAG TPA: glycosyltransferase family 39 protein [Solirubrobacteraceae bacterium]|jgi:mannosyltransferase|nr:glycosyltransferase family 39 protein [Solirubrobacteraceae bacterium]